MNHLYLSNFISIVAITDYYFSYHLWCYFELWTFL